MFDGCCNMTGRWVQVRRDFEHTTKAVASTSHMMSSRRRTAVKHVSQRESEDFRRGAWMTPGKVDNVPGEAGGEVAQRITPMTEAQRGTHASRNAAKRTPACTWGCLDRLTLTSCACA